MLKFHFVICVVHCQVYAGNCFFSIRWVPVGCCGRPKFISVLFAMKEFCWWYRSAIVGLKGMEVSQMEIESISYTWSPLHFAIWSLNDKVVKSVRCMQHNLIFVTRVHVTQSFLLVRVNGDVDPEQDVITPPSLLSKFLLEFSFLSIPFKDPLLQLQQVLYTTSLFNLFACSLCHFFYPSFTFISVP